MPTLLIVDDEEAIRILLSRAAEIAGYCVVTASTLDAALQIVAQRQLDVAVVDGWLENSATGACESANPICQQLSKQGVPFCRFSGHPPREEDLIGAGWLVKPQRATAIMEKVAEMRPPPG